MDRLSASAVAGTAVIAAQLAGGRFGPTPNRPRTAAWYAALRKPAFTPPGPVFGAAWTALDALLGYAGYRLLSAPPGPRRRVALGLWSLNVLGVAGFSWVLFGRKRLGEATGVTAGMVLSALGTVAAARRVDRPAALACVPLAGWVVFAAVLQEEVWRRNRRQGSRRYARHS
jgi:tryptophan-rich sensory protein